MASDDHERALVYNLASSDTGVEIISLKLSNNLNFLRTKAKRLCLVLTFSKCS
jgi:hypothetical protein